jgi:hypothetical protein
MRYLWLFAGTKTAFLSTCLIALNSLVGLARLNLVMLPKLKDTLIFVVNNLLVSFFWVILVSDTEDGI